MGQWIAAGHKLRFAAVSHESGKLRYVAETGRVFERDNFSAVFDLPTVEFDDPACQALREAVSQIEVSMGEMRKRRIRNEENPIPLPGDPDYTPYQNFGKTTGVAKGKLSTCIQAHPRVVVPDFRIAVNASCALPSFLLPQVMGGESYVDGGIRDVMPIAVAAQLGATQIYAVNDSAWLEPQSKPSDFLDIALRALMGVTVDEVAYRSATAVTDPAVKVWLIQCTYAGPNDLGLHYPSGIYSHQHKLRLHASRRYSRPRARSP